MPVNFVDDKLPDMGNVGRLLEACRVEGRWANRGPLYRQLQTAFQSFMSLGDDVCLTPVANGGVALEALARLHHVMRGGRLRWVGSAYSHRNLGRGYFSDMVLVDCDARGLLDLDQLAALDPKCYDGVIVTNPFGLFDDFSRYFDFARQRGIPLLIDNAAGIGRSVPDWPWQAFSLHHTKPFGMGEGGMALTPAGLADALYELVDYARTPDPADAWLGNGKLSDLSCAFILDRLERADEWIAQYATQRERITGLAIAAGFEPLVDVAAQTPVMGVAFLGARPVPASAVAGLRHFRAAKYYEPLRDTPNARRIFDRVVCLPAHPGMAQLSDAQIASDLRGLSDPGQG